MGERKVGIKEGLNYIGALGNETHLKNHIAYFEKKVEKEIEPYKRIEISISSHCHNFSAWIRLYTELICNKSAWSLYRAIGDWGKISDLSFRELRKSIKQEVMQAKSLPTKHKLQNMIKALHYVIELRHSFQHGGMPNPMPRKRRKIDEMLLLKMANPRHYKRTKIIFSCANELLELLPKTVIRAYPEGYLKEKENKKSRLDELYEACNKLIELAKEMLETCCLKKEKVKSYSRVIVSFYFRRSWEMLESFITLIKAGRLVDAALLLRSLCDMAINLGYMTADPNRKKIRAMRLMLEGNRAQLKLINTNLKGFKDLDSNIEARRDELKEDLEKIEADWKKEYQEENWELPTIEQRARKAGEVIFNYYNLVYRPYSNIEHHNIFFGQDYVDKEKCEPIEELEKFTKSPVFRPDITLYMFKGLFLVILSKFNKEFQLKGGDEIKKRLEKHKEEYKLYKK